MGPFKASTVLCFVNGRMGNLPFSWGGQRSRNEQGVEIKWGRLEVCHFAVDGLSTNMHVQVFSLLQL